MHEEKKEKEAALPINKDGLKFYEKRRSLSQMTLRAELFQCKLTRTTK
jgi:hypothetical protein